MADSISQGEFLKLAAGERCTIVRNNDFRNSMCRENGLAFGNGMV